MSIDAEQILREACKTGDMNYSSWPEVLKHVLPLLDRIVHEEFPTPKTTIATPTPPRQLRTQNGADADTSTPTRSPRVIPATPQNPSAIGSSVTANVTSDQQATSPSMVPNSQPPASTEDLATASDVAGQVAGSVSAAEGSLPPPILTLYNGIVSMLNGPFSQIPPYTLQRLSELILQPRAHYQTLPAYLRALDKILNVASTANLYPLPIAPDSGATESDSYLSQPNGIGSRARDDAFNGAELTRIPWVTENAEIEGDVDAPGEREDGTLQIGLNSADQTARMLLRNSVVEVDRERRTSPNAADPDLGHTTTVVANGLGRNGAAAGGVAASGPADGAALQAEASEGDAALVERRSHAEEGGRDAEMATARGPQEIGNEDIGPQRTDAHGMPGIVDLEAAVGRPGEGEVVPGSNVQVPEERRAASEESKETTEEIDEKAEEMAVDEPEKKDE